MQWDIQQAEAIPHSLNTSFLTVRAHSPGGNVVCREVRQAEKKKGSEPLLLCAIPAPLLHHCIRMNTPTIVTPPSAPCVLAARGRWNETKTDTSDREQKSLTTGSISPKQKTLHNIL